MGLVRMFHYSCDAYLNRDCEGETGDSWYASEAKALAIKAGWHISAKTAICPECWDNGARHKNIAE